MKIKLRKWFSGKCNESVPATDADKVYFIFLVGKMSSERVTPIKIALAFKWHSGKTPWKHLVTSSQPLISSLNVLFNMSQLLNL